MIQQLSSLTFNLILIAAVIIATVFPNYGSAIAGKDKRVLLPNIGLQFPHEHARELLGEKYTVTAASNERTAQDLINYISQEFKEQLPAKYKTQAPNLASKVLNLGGKYDFDPLFILAIIDTESKFNPTVRGTAGEIGLMQLKPSTAKYIAKKMKIKYRGPKDLENPQVNIQLGAAYLKYLRQKFKGHPHRYLAAYNLGVTRINRLFSKNQKPKEYVMRVMAKYLDLHGRLSPENPVRFDPNPFIEEGVPLENSLQKVSANN